MPKTAIISYRTSHLPALLPPLTLKQLPPIVVLSLCVLYEIRQGKLSRYHGYVQSLPSDCVPLATLWDVYELFGDDGMEASRWLVGTEVERETKRMKKEGHGRVGGPKEE
jgi:N-lysine methyltransferase SETD6